VLRQGASVTDIHYFPRYSQAENFVTNNTLLLILRLYQYNRLKFQKFMEKLCGDEQDIQLSTSWLHFQQQRVTDKSVLDGFISQDSIKIAVETKLTDNFDFNQLKNHLTVFGAEQHRILIMLSPTSLSDSQLRSIQAQAKDIQVLHASFEGILEKARSCLSDHDEEMLALVDDYESFCSEMSLLPRDKYLIFVPPCRQSLEDNLKFKLYYCPAAWTRRKAKYLGFYADKAVQAIGRIAKIVTCDVDLDTDNVLVKDSGTPLVTDEEQRIINAAKNARKHGWNLSTAHKFYLCDDLCKTNFRKISAGGIMGHRYFDLEEILGSKIPDSTADIASLLRLHTWPGSKENG
jgi:hypothetical protein